MAGDVDRPGKRKPAFGNLEDDGARNQRADLRMGAGSRTAPLWFATWPAECQWRDHRHREYAGADQRTLPGVGVPDRRGCRNVDDHQRHAEAYCARACVASATQCSDDGNVHVELHEERSDSHAGQLGDRHDQFGSNAACSRSCRRYRHDSAASNRSCASNDIAAWRTENGSNKSGQRRGSGSPARRGAAHDHLVRRN